MTYSIVKHHHGHIAEDSTMGTEAIRRLQSIDKDVKAIVSSGYTDDPVMANYCDYGFGGVVTKPYDFRKLSAVLHDVLWLRESKTPGKGGSPEFVN